MFVDRADGYSYRVTDPPRTTTTTTASPNGPARVLPGATPERPLAGFIGPLSAEKEVLRSGPRLIPSQVTLDNPAPRPTRFAGLEADDPRNDMLDTAVQLQTIDQQAHALANQPIDIGAAQGRVQAALDSEKQFFAGVFKGLSRSQNQVLGQLADEIQRAPDNEQAAAKFEQTLGAMLTPQQRAQLQALQRDIQRTQNDLQGQLIGQELRAAQFQLKTSCAPEQKAEAATRVSLILAEARIHVSAVRQLEVSIKAQDAYGLVMTPELQQKLSGPQKELADAARTLALDPENQALQQAFALAKQRYDAVFKANVNPHDQLTLQNLDAIVQREASLGALLEQEADTQLRYVQLHAEMKKMCFGGPQRPQYDLAKADYDLLQSTHALRDLALRAAGDPQQSEKLLEELAAGMIDVAKRNADGVVNHAQLDYDMAVRESLRRYDAAHPPALPNGTGGVAPALTSLSAQALTTPAINGPPAAVAANGQVSGLPGVQNVSAPYGAAFAAPVTDPMVEEAKRRLDTAIKSRDDLYEALKPPPAPQRSGWDYALEIATGVLEVAGGLIIAAGASWTGAGAVFGVAVAIDGAVRTAHSISDAVNGTTTDAPLSALLQKAPFIDRGAANRIDTGVSMVGLFGPGGVGAALTAIRSGNMLLKGVSAASALMIGDTLQAQARYVVFNNVSTPGSIKLLTSMGMSELQANYVLFGATAIGISGLGAMASRRHPTMAAREAFARFRGTALPNLLREDFVRLPGQPDPALSAVVPSEAGHAGAAATTANSGAPATSGGVPTPDVASVPARSADYYDYASRPVLLEAAEVMLGPDATTKAVRTQAKKLRNGPLVVVREGDTMVAAAALRLQSTGRLGLDGARKVVKPHMAEIAQFGGVDSVGIRQVLLASVKGAEQFTGEQGIFWHTLDQDDSQLVYETIRDDTGLDRPTLLKGLDDQPSVVVQRVRQNAIELLEEMPPEQLDWEVSEILGNGTLSKNEKLTALAKVMQDERGAWPVGSQEIHYALSFNRPAAVLGSTVLGKVFHWMHPHSYLGKVNHRANPVNATLKFIDWSGPKLRSLFKVPLRPVTEFAARNTREGPRTAYAYRAGTLDDATLREIASHDLRVNSGRGNLWSVLRGIEWTRVDKLVRSLRGRDVIILRELDRGPGTESIAGAAAVTFGFKGFRAEQVAIAPHLAGREQYAPGTAYLSDVTNVLRAGGRQIVIAAVDWARQRGARRLDFLTQWQGAQNLYVGLATQADLTTGKIPMPTLQTYDVRFTKNAAQVLLNLDAEQMAQLGTRNPELLAEIESHRGRPAELQTLLEGKGNQLQALAGQMPDGALMARYRIKFDTKDAAHVLLNLDAEQLQRLQTDNPELVAAVESHHGRPAELQALLKKEGRVPDGALLARYGIESDLTSGKWYDVRVWPQRTRWAIQDGYWFLRKYSYGMLKNGVANLFDKPAFETAVRRVATAYRTVSPFGLRKDIEPGRVRGALQDATFGVRNVIRHGWKAWRGAALAATVPQVASGDAYFVTDDDRALAPFNGLPGSPSLALYFKWTGTMVTLWGSKGVLLGNEDNIRGPWPMENGLYPLARVSPPLTDPGGPKGAGFLAAGRIILGGELNVGVRWFGTNDGISAVSGASLRFLPINGNLRGDVPVQAGAVANVSVLGSLTWFMPSVSHSFFWHEHGLMIRNLHLTLSGTTQTAQVTAGGRWAAYRSGSSYTVGSKEVTTGSGLFYTPNPAYGSPNFDPTGATPVRDVLPGWIFG